MGGSRLIIRLSATAEQVDRLSVLLSLGADQPLYTAMHTNANSASASTLKPNPGGVAGSNLEDRPRDLQPHLTSIKLE